jgi:hypothetical protein
MKPAAMSAARHKPAGVSLWKSAWVALGALCTVACTSTIEQKALEDHQATQVRTQLATDQLYAAQRRNPVVKLDTVTRFTGKTVAYQPTQMLPAHIGRVTMRMPGRHNLRTVAGLIERMVNIPVTLSSDALLPQSEFAPMASAQAGASRAPGATPSPMTAPGGAGGNAQNPATAVRSEEAELTKNVARAVQKAGGPRTWLEEAGAETEIELNHQGTLVGLLDHVALHMGLKWRYSEGRIHFYRMVNRTFVVRTMPGNMTQTGGVSVGLMTVTGNSDVNVWGGIEKNLALLLSRHGRSHVDQSMGSVTVHDASTNVEAVDRYIDSLNRQLGRQVALHVEVLQVTLSNDHQAGIDWGWVVGLNGGNLSLTGPPSLTKDAASVGIMGTDGNNQWMVRALERFGRVSSAYASVITTMNRQAVPLGSQSTQSYLRQIGSTTITAANGTSMFGPPSLLPGEITTGFSMILLPIVLDSNHVLMHCAISISSLKGLETFSSGVGLSQQSLQQPNVAKFDTQQRMTVKSGETIVLSGYENDSTESKQTDVVRNALPGSRVNSRNKTTLVVLITPKLLDI